MHFLTPKNAAKVSQSPLKKANCILYIDISWSEHIESNEQKKVLMTYFDAHMADIAIHAIHIGHGSVTLSCDLNLSEVTLRIENHHLILDDGTVITLQQLERMGKTRTRIYVLDGTELRLLEIRHDDYTKLVPTQTAPYLEASGVKLHISKGVCPFESAGRMTETVVKKGFVVLDTCSGLGYCALRSARLGARQTVTVEINADILQLRSENPWSRGLYTDDSIIQKHEDVTSLIKTLDGDTFDAVIHDPPRFSLAGELYGDSFYQELKRVLKKRGVLFHYTGNPYTVKHGNSFVSGVTKRLHDAGFRKVLPQKELMGVKAFA
jgi:predicted methyltransferase